MTTGMMNDEQQGINVNWRGGLEKMVAELDRQRKSRIDFVIAARDLEISVRDDGKLMMTGRTLQAREFFLEPQVVTGRALVQLFGERVTPGGPGGYAQKLAEARPDLMAHLLNELLVKHPKDPNVLVRLLDGKVRAVMSNRYRIFDDLDVAIAALEVVKENNGRVLECSANEAGMRLKFCSPHMVDYVTESRGGGASQEHRKRATLDPNELKDIGLGAVCPFTSISHSSVGDGGLNVGLGVMRLACLNGAVAEQAMNQIHMGQAMGAGVFRYETILAHSKAVMMQAQDLVRTSLRPETFNRIVNLCRGAANEPISSPKHAVDQISDTYAFTEAEADAILTHFIRDYDSNRWGLTQAVSRASQDIADADRAARMERAAGELLTASI